MTILVGYPPSRRSRNVLNLAAVLARSSGEDLVVCTVVPAPWLPTGATADDEYHAHLDATAEAALEQARADLPDDIRATFIVQRARSKPSGLLHAAEEHGAEMIVLGSSRAGMFGYITLSTVAGRLLHSSPIPIALAPRGFRAGPNSRIDRVTVAYDGSGETDQLLTATQLALRQASGVTIRLACFAVQPAPPDTALMRVEADQVAAEWTADVRAAADKVLARLGDSAPALAQPDVVVGRGENWSEALEDIYWEPGDVLVIGSSRSGPLTRVFLGTHAAKIIRYSPVPVVVVPRKLAARVAASASTDRD